MEKKKLVNIRSIKNTGENSNMPSQHLPLGFHLDEKWAYVRNLKLDDINLSKITLVIGADFPEAFTQQDIKKVEMGNLY